MPKNKKRKPMLLPSTSKAGRQQREKVAFEQMKHNLAAMDPDTVLHVGERLVMTEAELQQRVVENGHLAEVFKLLGDDEEHVHSDEIYKLSRMALGLQKTMTASELLAALEANPPA